MALKKQQFESDLFGRPIAVIETLQSDISPPITTSLDQFDIIQAKVSSQNSPTIDQLTLSGFRLCEGEINLELSLNTGSRSETPTNVRHCRCATEKDISSLSELAATYFEVKTKFRRPWYSEEEARLMYSTWVTKAVRGEFDDVCLIIEGVGGEIMGFITLRKTQESSDVLIGLLAVRKSARRQGLGGALLEAASRWALENGGKRLMVATQMSNIAAMRLYFKANAKPVSTSYWFYRQRG